MLEKNKILAGYDPDGIVYDEKSHILRKITHQKIFQAKKIYDLYQKHNFKKLGIVETEIFSEKPDFIFKHKKHLISYPHEWTASMFKQATLFHLKLFIELDKHGLILKDALPNNIVFDFSNPVFVDFLSLTLKNKLSSENWLVEINKKNTDLSYTIFDEMFFPYFFIPYIIMSRRNYTKTRHIMLHHACNTNPEKPSWKMLLDECNQRKKLQRYKETMRLYLSLLVKRKSSFNQFCTKLYNMLATRRLLPPQSNYSSYYEVKNEAFSFHPNNQWNSKQKNVHAALTKQKPQQVLDLGANTGWFSVLAAKNEAHVIATDIDEASIDQLFLHAQKNKLPILSLLLPFENLEKEHFGFTQTGPEYKDRDFEKNPLFRAATDRLKSDMVLCLALIHHLVLGSGHSINSIMKTLAKLSIKTLILEFVEIDDPLIKNDHSFFKNISKHSHQTYNLELIIKAGLNHFKNYEIVDSHPVTRKLIILKK